MKSGAIRAATLSTPGQALTQAGCVVASTVACKNIGALKTGRPNVVAKNQAGIWFRQKSSMSSKAKQTHQWMSLLVGLFAGFAASALVRCVASQGFVPIPEIVDLD